MSDQSRGEADLVLLSERITNSPAFGLLFREGMDLVEETAAYLDGAGRTEAKALERAASLTYATESMRLTTRLMQLASWLLLHRAGRGVALESIGAADYRFLESLQAGGTFGEAFDAGLAADGGFDVAAALRRAVGRGLLADPQAASGNGAGRAIT